MVERDESHDIAELIEGSSLGGHGARELRGRGAGEVDNILRFAAENGDAEAMVHLGIRHESRGEMAAAEAWYRRAAEAGEVSAMVSVARILGKSIGRHHEVVTWLRRAIEEGDTQAGALLEKALQTHRQTVLNREGGGTIVKVRVGGADDTEAPTSAMTDLRVLARETSRRNHLLMLVRDGDQEALNELIVELTPLLWNVVRSQGIDRFVAEDVVQDTWLRLLSNLHRIETPEVLVGWLVTVAKREAVRLWKAGCREEPVEPDWDSYVADQTDVGDAVAERSVLLSRSKVIWHSIGQLTPRCQDLLRVIAFAEVPDYSVAAAALGLPRSSIGPPRGRCLAKLRQLLSADPAWQGQVE